MAVFFRFDMATRAFFLINRQSWEIRDKWPRLFLNLTGDMGLKVVSNMGQGY